jgi:quercetin dioxygenase-like cupin family protein
MSVILETLKEATAITRKTNEKLDLLQKLLTVSNIRLQKGVAEIDEQIKIKTIYSNGATITTSVYRKGGLYPDHCHDAIIEYLICIKGSFSVSLPGGHRILQIKDCASIPANIQHTVMALDDYSELIAICIPAEPAYKAIMCDK